MTLILIVATGLALSAIMALAWAFGRHRRNAGWSDVFWSYEMGLGGVVLALAPWGAGWHWQAPSARQWLVAALVALWSVRLGTHILRRTLGSPTEDSRYAQLRRDWREAFDSRLFWFLQIQALAAFVLVLSVGLAGHNPTPGLGAKDAIGALVLLCAIAGEGIADDQLRRFIADRANKGRICDAGLWSWTRHPNYFFEWLGWLAYPVIAVASGYPWGGYPWGGYPWGGYPWGWAALSGPLFMFVLLRYVSGVPPLEEHMARKHGGNFHAYAERVSAFFPLPPRKG